MEQLELHSVVVLLQDLPEKGLARGQVGTIVETWTPGVFEVGFSDGEGRAYLAMKDTGKLGDAQ